MGREPNDAAVAAGTITEDSVSLITDDVSGDNVATKAELQDRVAKAGDTMTGTLKMSGQNQIRFGTDDNFYYVKVTPSGQLAIFNNVAPQGYRDFFNENDEIVRVFKTRCGDLRYEITNFTLDSSISEVAVGNDVFWDGTNFGYIVGGTAASGIVKVGKVVELEGQFAAGLGLDSIVIDMDV